MHFKVLVLGDSCRATEFLCGPHLIKVKKKNKRKDKCEIHVLMGEKTGVEKSPVWVAIE